MSYLLDTHALLWLRLSPSKLSLRHRKILESPGEQKFISSLSIWEISLKYALGKLALGGHTPEEFLSTAVNLGLQVVTPTPEQFASFHRLPKLKNHKDPFDRMLIWQAVQSGHVLVSSDRQVATYDIDGLAVA